ncbi:MAG: ribosome maturation factor RimP [Calditerricola sp.]|nr:ribosome maturation factor RimP [Bacillota bacterium]MCG0313369.1 ribosome maturation factor RimP [Calditerricola sp.]
MSQSIEALVEQLAAPILEEEGCELVDVEFKREGRSWYLRLYIDKEGGVDIEDCSRVSERLSARLDEVDPIPQAYFLEVSSPGAERPLTKPRHFHWAVGKAVHVTTRQPLDRQNVFQGYLTSFDGQTLVIEDLDDEGSVYTIPYDLVAKARLLVVWE